MWVLLRPPRFGGAKYANDHDNWFRHRQVGFQAQGIDAEGKVIIRRQLKRRYVLTFFQKLPPCLVGIEACATSHHWSRELKALCDLGLIVETAQPGHASRRSRIRNSARSFISAFVARRRFRELAA